ncbi:MAG TPA: aldo/keto reductase [Chthoniobacterales bacterium]
MSKHEYEKRTPHGIRPIPRNPVPVTGTSVRPVQRDRLSWHQFTAEETRYEKMPFRACGRSGLKLPALSLGAWETFGGYVGPEAARACIFRAFNLGITHFDLANDYGTPAGRAEIIAGRTLREMPREELIISTKAGRRMWPGPYGEGNSRKSLLTSIDQSLKRLGLDYVDIFYSHRPDATTPLEETLRALDHIVRQGKALYIGLSNYPATLFAEACRLAHELNLAPIVVAQVGYNMLRRDIERDLLGSSADLGTGVVGYSALAHGVLSTKYLDGIPEGSRAMRRWSPAQREDITPVLKEKIRQLNDVATARGQTLPQMAIAWTLRTPQLTSALIGASDIDQVEENANALEKLAFNDEELRRIEAILGS